MPSDPKFPTGELNYGFGSLNAVGEPDSFGAYDPQTSTAVGTLKNLVGEQFTPNILAGTGDYRGICLRVDKISQHNVAGSWVPGVMGLGTDRLLLAVKVRIPELHACLPEPLTEGVMDQKIVNMYPTFIASDTSLSNDAPSAGDIVNVGFQDKVNMTGPMFYGKVFSKPVGINTTTTGQGAFGKSKNKNVSKSAGPFIPDSNTQAKAQKATADAIKAGLSKDDDCVPNNGLGKWCAWRKGNMLGKKNLKKWAAGRIMLIEKMFWMPPHKKPL